MAQEYEPAAPELQGCTNCGQTLSESDRFCPSCGAVVPGFGAAVDPLTAEHMGFWIRFIAMVIDLVAVGLMQGVVTAILLPISGPFAAIPAYCISPAYFVLFTGLKGQTLGKMVTGVKIVNSQGGTPGLWRAALREIVGKFISGISLLLGYLWAGWDSRKRAWHDHISGTYAIRATNHPAVDPESHNSDRDSF